MFSLEAELRVFHDNHVRLPTDDLKRLAEVRDINLGRIHDGLIEAGKPSFSAWVDQGGFAMDTMIIDPQEESDHDIDVALIFDSQHLPATALSARQRVSEAAAFKGKNFVREPEPRTNAVTVWYQDGYHADFAVYRVSSKGYEHAGAEWRDRDPLEVTNWFNDAVDRLSPKASPQQGQTVAVKSGQLRRVVRFVKRFCRSRSSWCLPGGMIATTLVVESYRPNAQSDERALYDTLVALRNRFSLSGTRVYHPCGGGRELTGKNEFHAEVKNFQKRLNEVLKRLAVLHDAACTRDKARFAWDWIFNHPFWADREPAQKAAAAASLPYNAAIKCELAYREGGKSFGEYISGSRVLPKDLHLKFSLASTNAPLPYDVRWVCDNEGEEAEEGRASHWEDIKPANDTVRWTSTKYRGDQRMTCQIEHAGKVIARARHVVRIARGSIARKR